MIVVTTQSVLELPPDDAKYFLDESSTDDDDEDELLESVFDQPFHNHHMGGSDVFYTAPTLDLEEALALLVKHPGKEIVMELFGGKGSTGLLCIRKKLGTASNFDVAVGIDLLNPKHVQAMKEHLLRHKPLVLVCGPPCTSFGAWSRFNSLLH